MSKQISSLKTLVVILGVLLTLIGYYKLEQSFNDSAIEQQLRFSRLVTTLIERSRVNYSRFTLAKIQKSDAGLETGFDHSLSEKKIPNPATFGIELAQSVSNEQTRIWMYSNNPFPWRKDDSVPKNEIEKVALELLSSKAQDEYYKVIDGSLFYAIPVVMNDESCINCHNNHPSSSKLDWKIGDTRSVLAVRTEINIRRNSVIYGLVFISILICTALTYFLFRKERSLQKAISDSTVDPLTKVYNRAFIDIKFKEMFKRDYLKLSKRNGISICVIDIDNFKLLNDTFGHQSGDNCLVALADILRKHTRQSIDLVTRWGGEEFLVYLKFVDSEQSHKVITRVLADFKQTKITGVTSGLSFSAGICHLTGSQEVEFDDAFKIADAQMYIAKKSGKSTVRIVDY
ncbi:MAG: diguanylate cyclase [Oceanospirillaceae bacterium]|nr:diguanylate cyclase [Oceanospirillaceae bacterium]